MAGRIKHKERSRRSYRQRPIQTFASFERKATVRAIQAPPRESVIDKIKQRFSRKVLDK